jgi:hypothetical protein
MPCFSSPNDFLCNADGTAKWSSGSRPVDVKFDSCHRLLITDDGADQVLIVSYTGNPSPPGSDAAGTCTRGSTPAPVTSGAARVGGGGGGLTSGAAPVTSPTSLLLSSVPVKEPGAVLSVTPVTSMSSIREPPPRFTQRLAQGWSVKYYAIVALTTICFQYLEYRSH